MIRKRPSAERGREDHGWLDSAHTFSFANYFDPAHMGFRSLRVLNEDVVRPGQGFGTHPHRDMEILTWVLQGALEHKDSMGNGSVIRPDELQRMTAGTGLTHSEFNHSPDEPVHVLQIWILPGSADLEPDYEQMAFDDGMLRNRLHPVAGRSLGQGGVTVHQDVCVYVGRLDGGAQVDHILVQGRHAWLQVARGRVRLDGMDLEAGDGAAVSAQAHLTLRAEAQSELLLFDLA